jgi:phosphopantothenoylcysteine decarboxylase/phosphopantothenate--cysteine ligase
MPEPETIFAHAARLLERDDVIRGKNVVVTAGATREPLDPVRFISNHSSGLMGTAVAAAAWRRGANVTLVAGHLDVPLPAGVTAVRAVSTEEMATAVQAAVRGADVLVMAAAPADFRPARAAGAKTAKGDSASTLELVPTTDILASLGTAAHGALLVGFALETGEAEKKAKAKLAGKNLDLIVVNDQTEEGAGFGGQTNRVTILTRDGGREELPLMLKTELADVLLDRVGALLNGR